MKDIIIKLVHYTLEFIKQLNQLGKQTRIRVMKWLDFLEFVSFVGKRLVGCLSNSMSLRVGKYRVICGVLENIRYSDGGVL